MKNYICQILSQSGSLIESDHEDFFEAVHRCIHASKKHYIMSSKVFANEKEGLRPVVVARIIK